MKKISAWIMIMIFVCGIIVTGPAMTAEASANDSVDFGALLGDVKDKLTEAVSDMDQETVKEIFAFIREKVQDGSLKTEDGLEKAISEGKEKFGVTISKADAKKVVETMEKLEDLGFSGEYVMEKAEALYDRYGADFIDHADEVITGAVQNAVSNAADSFFRNLWDSTKNFFKNLFSGL